MATLLDGLKLHPFLLLCIVFGLAVLLGNMFSSVGVVVLLFPVARPCVILSGLRREQEIGWEGRQGGRERRLAHCTWPSGACASFFWGGRTGFITEDPLNLWCFTNYMVWTVQMCMKLAVVNPAVSAEMIAFVFPLSTTKLL